MTKVNGKNAIVELLTTAQSKVIIKLHKSNVNVIGFAVEVRASTYTIEEVIIVSFVIFYF